MIFGVIFFSPLSPGKMMRTHQETGQFLALIIFLFYPMEG